MGLEPPGAAELWAVTLAVTLAYHSQGGSGLKVTCSHRQDHVGPHVRCLSPFELGFPWGMLWARRVLHSGIGMGPALGNRTHPNAPLLRLPGDPGHPAVHLQETRQGPSLPPPWVHTVREQG